jgi:hypothetical protein
MDEIDYFSKRDKFKTRKELGSDWNKLKKQKNARLDKVKPTDSSIKEETKKK